jgi:hypothetical protein
MKYRLTVEEVCKLLKEHFEANSCTLENKYDTDTYFELDVKTEMTFLFD